MKASIAQDTVPSTFPVQWHWELVVWKQTKRPMELRKSLSCLFLVASPAGAKGGASFVPTHRQQGLAKGAVVVATSSSISNGHVPTAVLGDGLGNPSHFPKSHGRAALAARGCTGHARDPCVLALGQGHHGPWRLTGSPLAVTPAGLKGACAGSKQDPSLPETLPGAAPSLITFPRCFAIAQMLLLQELL